MFFAVVPADHGTVFHSSRARKEGARREKDAETYLLFVSGINKWQVIQEDPYPVWTKFGKEKVFHPIHMIFRASMLNQSHSTLDMCGNGCLRSPLNGLDVC
jgi:hypothetical protein